MLIIVAGQTYRTGTTLVQRLLNCSNQCMIWGEDNTIIPSACNIINNYNSSLERSNKQKELFFKDKNTFSANMLPDYPMTLFNLKAFIVNSYNCGGLYPNWGFKQIIFRQSDYSIIDYLFPNYKIVYCTRNKEDAFNSYQDVYGHKKGMYTNEQLENLYNLSIPTDKVNEFKNVIHFPFEEISEESCVNLLDKLSIPCYNDVESVVNLKIREMSE